MLSFEEIEDCFPNGAVSLPDGWIGVTAQWMHDLARAIEAAVLDEKQEPVKDEPVAYLAGMYRSVIEGKAENIPLGATISFINMGWKNQIELYTRPQPDLTAEVGRLKLSAEHWNRLYREKCQEFHDAQANKGQEIVWLIDRIAELEALVSTREDDIRTEKMWVQRHAERIAELEEAARQAREKQ